MRWTRPGIAAAVVGVSLLVGGSSAAYALSGSSTAAVAATPTPTPTLPTAKTAPAPAPARTIYVTRTPAPSTPAAAPAQAPASAAVPSQPAADPQFTSAVAVIAQYYQDITDQDYQAAWALGGGNVSNGVGYDAWVAGYSTTASIALSGQSTWDSGAVQTAISAVQTDGSVNTYYGTYYVTNGVITSASIAQTG